MVYTILPLGLELYTSTVSMEKIMENEKKAKASFFDKSFFESRMSFYLLLFISFILLFNDLSKPGLPSNDDCAKAQRGWEMLQSSNCLTPTLAGRPNFDHPPLYIGMLALSMAVFGKTEFAARFPGVLCAFLVIFVVYQIGRSVKNRATGWWAGFFLVTSYLFLKISRRVQADIPFMLFASLALLFFIRAMKRSENKKEGWKKAVWMEFACFGLCAGLSGLVKSVFIAFPLGAPFIFLMLKPDLLKKLFFPYFVSSVAAVVIAGWWYLYEFLQYRNKFVEEFIGQFLSHHAGGGSGMGKYGYFGYLYEFTRHFLPWLPVLLLCIWWIVKSEKLRRNVYIHLLAIFAFLPVLVLSFTGDKAARYILFIYAPVVLIMASAIEEKINIDRLLKYARVAVISIVIIAAFVIIRPVEYGDEPNKIFMNLSEQLNKGKVVLVNGATVYRYGASEDFRGNYRGLLYYTGLELAGVLRTDEEVSGTMNLSKPFYLIIGKKDLNEFLNGNFQIAADLGESVLLVHK